MKWGDPVPPDFQSDKKVHARKEMRTRICEQISCNSKVQAQQEYNIQGYDRRRINDRCYRIVVDMIDAPGKIQQNRIETICKAEPDKQPEIRGDHRVADKDRPAEDQDQNADSRNTDGPGEQLRVICVFLQRKTHQCKIHFHGDDRNQQII